MRKRRQFVRVKNTFKACRPRKKSCSNDPTLGGAGYPKQRRRVLPLYRRECANTARGEHVFHTFFFPRSPKDGNRYFNFFFFFLSILTKLRRTRPRTVCGFRRPFASSYAAPYTAYECADLEREERIFLALSAR